MPGIIYLSNSSGKLAEQLASNIKNKKSNDIFKPKNIFVPNFNLKKWLELKLTMHNDILFNCEFLFLEAGLFKFLKEIYNKYIDPTNELDFLNRNILFQLVFKTIYDYFENTQDNLISKYLNSSDNKSRYSKLIDITNKITDIFIGYSYNREEYFEKWENNELILIDREEYIQEVEQLQKTIFLEIFKKNGLRSQYCAKTGKRYKTLFEIANSIIKETKSVKNIKIEKDLHIFGATIVSKLYKKIFYILAKYYNFYLYELSVCSEFWEDVNTLQEQRWMNIKNIKIIEDIEGNEELAAGIEQEDYILSRWGKLGRESIKVFNELEYELSDEFTRFQSDFIYENVDENKNVLNRFKSNILQRKIAEGKFLQDKSLQIIACPGILREIETIYNSIIYNLKADENLKLTDIAILAPDVDKYYPSIFYFFKRKENKISFNFIDFKGIRISEFSSAIEVIIKFLKTGWTRESFLNLIENSFIRNRFNMKEEDVRIFSKWLDELGVYNLYSKDDSEYPEYNDTNIFTFVQANIRLCLSRILDEQINEGKEIDRDFQGYFVYEDMYSREISTLSKFLCIVEKLEYYYKKIKQIQKTKIKDALLFFKKIFNELILVKPDNYSELNIKKNFYKSLNQAEDLEIFLNQKVDINIIFNLISGYLENISASVGSYLTEGITISSVLPMRPIPFKIIYFVGLNEGIYPGKKVEDFLDLRNFNRKILDISKKDIDRYLFLEMFFNAKEKVYLTYNYLDLIENTKQEKSILLKELIEYLEENILKQNFREIIMPLKNYDKKFLIENKELEEITDVFNIYDNKVNYINLNNLKKFFKSDKVNFERINFLLENFKEKDIYNIAEEPVKPVKQEQNIRKINIRRVSKFLKSTFLEKLKIIYNLYNDEFSFEQQIEDEPFEIKYPVNYELENFFIKFYLKKLKETENIEDIKVNIENELAELYKVFQNQSRTGKIDFVENNLIDNKKIDILMTLKGKEKIKGLPLYNILIGELQHLKKIDKYSNAVRIEVDDKEYLISGEYENLIYDEINKKAYAIVLPKDPSKSKSAKDSSKLNEIILFYMLYVLSDLNKEKEIKIFEIFYSKTKSYEIKISKEEAQVYLKNILEEMYNEEFYYLSLKLVKKASKELLEGEKDAFEEKIKEEYIKERESTYDYLARIKINDLEKIVEKNLPDKIFDKSQKLYKFLFIKRDGG